MAAKHSNHYKPLPQSRAELLNEATKNGLQKGKTSDLTQREIALKCVWETMQLDRSENQASILIVGGTGAGKSSTINHLFSLNGDKRLKAEVSDEESQTKSAQEYILECDDDKYAIKDATLSIIDTPGFNDTDGQAQDAANMRSIQVFFKNHPSLKGKKPNLVFLCLNANENRFKGPQSNFSKSVRCLKNLGVIDTRKPNVVGIITHACSIPFTKLDVWQKKLDDKKTSLHEIIENTLGIKSAPVVFLENEFEDYDLERPSLPDGSLSDYTRLPNRELQPRNLFLACLEVLKKSQDSLGEILLNACFLSANDLRKKLGLETTTKDVKKSSLDKEEEKILSWFNNLANVRGDELSQIEDRSLQEFSVNYCQPQEQLSLLNRGFDITTGKENTAEIFQLEYKDSRIGILVPTCCSYEKLNETCDVMESFESKSSFMQQRLRDLNVKIDVDSCLLNFKFGAGFNEESKFKSERCTKSYSFLREHRSAKISIRNYSSPSMKFTSDFKNVVDRLPDKYESSNEDCKQTFGSFFDRFGHYVVTSVFAGGSVSGYVTDTSTQNESFDSTKKKLLATLNFACINASSSVKLDNESDISGLLNVSLSQLQWKGGDTQLHTDKTLVDHGIFEKWRFSLHNKPVVLTNEMSLEPISTFIGLINKDKEKATISALKDLFDIKLKSVRHKEEEKRIEEAKKAEEAKQKEELTKKETVENNQSNQSGGGCFAFSSFVHCLDIEGNLKPKTLSNLEIGDRILAWNSSKKCTLYSEVIGFADYQEFTRTKFLILHLSDKNKLVLTPNHLVMVGPQQKGMAAQNVKIGDQLFVKQSKMDGSILSMQEVTSISTTFDNGYIAPITMEGNLFVDGVLASCYANVKDVLLFKKVSLSGQNIAHKAFAPLRLHYRVWYSKKENNVTRKQMHPYVKWLMSLKLSKNEDYSLLFE